MVCVQQILPTPRSTAVHMATQHMFILSPIRLSPLMVIKHLGNIRICLSRQDRLSGRRRDMSGKPRHMVTTAIVERSDKACSCWTGLQCETVPGELGRADVSVGDVWRQDDQTTGLSIKLISHVKSLVKLPGTKYLCLPGKIGSSVFYLQLSS